MTYQNIREEELKNKIASDWFADFDTTKIIGNVDFCVSKNHNPSYLKWTTKQGGVVSTLNQKTTSPAIVDTPLEEESSNHSLLWAEAKKGKSNIYHSFVQLILTIGKARTFDKELPPAFLGAFDAYQIAFIPYSDIQHIFYQNDFNWNVTPSNYETKEFKQIYEMVENILAGQNNSKTKKPNDGQRQVLKGILEKLK